MDRQLLRQLRDLEAAPRAPITPSELAALVEAFGPLPEAVLEIYRFYAGSDGQRGRSASLPARLMPPTEALSTTVEVHDLGWLERDVLLMWSDGDGNYAGVLLRDAVAARGMVFDHDEPDESPAFRDLESLVRALIDGANRGLALLELPGDYPVDADTGDDAIDDRDRTAANRYLEAARSAPNPRARRKALLAYLRLASPGDKSSVRPLLHDPDVYVRERVCELIGRWRYEDAAEEMAAVALTEEIANVPIQTIKALKRIGTAHAEEVLDRLMVDLPPGYAIYRR